MYTIYTQNMCGYCTMAKELFEDHSMEYKEIPIDTDTEAKNYVKSFAKTVPQIFREEQHIGGYEELKEHLYCLTIAEEIMLEDSEVLKKLAEL